MLLADYRMPQMNGIEFLEAAMDLFPLARRVLLTAYADTDAAIDAINVVDLDHYLLKPWNPPEEKLYPVVDALLDAWAADARRGRRRDPGGRAPLVGAVVRGARLPGPQPGAVPLAARRRAGGRAAARPRPGSTEADVPLVVTADGQDARARRARPSWPRSVGLDHHAGRRLLRPGRGRRRARPGSAPPSTAPRRACAPCWSSGGPPAGRPGRAAGSRTTSASPTASPARSSPTGPAGRRCKFGAELLTTREVVGLERARRRRGCVRFGDGSRDRRAHRGPGHRRVLPACWTRPGWPTSPAAASSTARPPPRRRAAPDEDVYIVGGANSAGQAAVLLLPVRHAGCTCSSGAPT